MMLTEQDARSTRDFALRLMKEVWETFDYTKLPEFYHPDVIGHHVSQTIRLVDIENRLQRDKIHWKDPLYEIKDLVVEPHKFAIRFLFSGTRIGTGKRDEGIETVYFYRLKGGRISEFWTMASIDYDYFDKT